MNNTQETITRKLLDAYEQVLKSKPSRKDSDLVLRRLIEIDQECPNRELSSRANKIISLWPGPMPRMRDDRTQLRKNPQIQVGRHKQPGWYTQTGISDLWSGPFETAKAAIAHSKKMRRVDVLWLVSQNGIATYAGPTS